MFKLIWNLFKITVFSLILVIIFNQFSSRFFLASFLRLQLGVPVEIGRAQVDFLNAEIRFEDVELWNPSGFPPGVMLYARQIVLDSELSRLFNRQPSFDRIEIDIDNIRVMKSMDRPLNILTLKSYKNQSEGPFFGVDEMVLSISQASFRDEAAAGAADLSKEIGLRRMTYQKVKSLKDVMDIINWETLKRMGLSSMTAGYLDRIREDLEGSGGFAQPRSANWR